MLLDEPFSGLDVMVRESIVRSLLSYIDFERQTVIITTHEIEEIEKILDEVIRDQGWSDHWQRKKSEDLRENSGKSVVGWLKENHR